MTTRAHSSIAPATLRPSTTEMIGARLDVSRSCLAALRGAKRRWRRRRRRNGPDACDAHGLGFLNNRHDDPTLGSFISVDPLVTTTEEPYIYGAANPLTYSDPSGLCVESIYTKPDGSIGIVPMRGPECWKGDQTNNGHSDDQYATQHGTREQDRIGRGWSDPRITDGLGV